MQRSWFHIFNKDNIYYDGTEPAFADPTEFAWTAEFERNADAIKKELLEYLKNNQLEGYFISSMVSRPESWKTISITTWGIEQYKNQKYFPITNALVKKYPQIVSASFNLLEPNSRILPHCGDTNTIYRCHLGLEIPGGKPHCGLTVRSETREWQSGKWLIFMDAYMHEAFNLTDKNRLIFVVDVVRDEFIDKKKQICAIVRTSLFLQRRWEKYTFLKSLPQRTVKLIAKLSAPLMQVAIRAVNLMKVY
jgi:aspartyl/asparaginyl beta-hydroxylase (cupin superfamily)